MTTRTMPIAQMPLFAEPDAPELDARLWHGSFNGRESTLQQLSPYVGKLKSGMVDVLLEQFTHPGDVVLDPFCGSGVVPLEAALDGRVAWANDLSPYAYTVTRGKLESPTTVHEALKRAARFLDELEHEAPTTRTEHVPEWVQSFFHPDTLREIVAAFAILRRQEDYFLMSCLLGILHHQRPGFLSYPSSHLVPYVRIKNFPPEQYPQLYTYRDVRSRLLAKIQRAYKRPGLPTQWYERQYHVWQAPAMHMPIEAESVDAIISSPPYFGALDYARDNRLRLWFLGCADWKQLDQSLTANRKKYLTEMLECIKEMDRVLRPNKPCVLVLGDVERDGKREHTAELLRDLAVEATNGRFEPRYIYDDVIPDERRTRRRTQTTKVERILVMHKRA